MSFWNHRLIKSVTPEGDWYAIHEVHYNDDGTPYAYTENPAVLCGNDAEEIKVTLERMKHALDNPALTDADFKGPGK